MKNRNGFQVRVSKWWLFIQAWFQKLLSTIISAKVLVTGTVIWVSTYLILAPKPHDVVLTGSDGAQTVAQVMTPYLTGPDFVLLLSTIVAAFLAARVAPSIIQAIGEAGTNIVMGHHAAKNGKTVEMVEDDEGEGS